MLPVPAACCVYLNRRGRRQGSEGSRVSRRAEPVFGANESSRLRFMNNPGLGILRTRMPLLAECFQCRRLTSGSARGQRVGQHAGNKTRKRRALRDRAIFAAGELQEMNGIAV